MCTRHAAVINSLVDYMDDLVDCFEDFVKKSLLVISVALGTIILMIMYVLKVMGERATIRPHCDGITGSAHQYQGYQSSETADWQNRGRLQENDSERKADPFTNNESEALTNTYVISGKMPTASIAAQVSGGKPIFDEKVLREIGLSSCSKPCATSKNIDKKESDTVKTKPIQVQQMCRKNGHLSNPHPCLKYIAIRTSCCSMCCVDDDKR